MSHATESKVRSGESVEGPHGQKYLATGESVSMRLWQDEAPGEPKAPTARSYETVGYVLKGRAELQMEGTTVDLKAGDSWVVPKGASHTYVIRETFSAVEATSPPGHVHGRDE